MTENLNCVEENKDNHIITEEILENMRDMGPWVKFLSIVGFVFIGLMFLFMVIFMTVNFPFPESEVPEGFGFAKVIGFVMFLFFAVIHFFPAYFLLKSSRGIKKMKAGLIVEGIEESVRYMKIFWMYAGILTIIVLCLYALFLIPTAGMVLFKLFAS